MTLSQTDPKPERLQETLEWFHFVGRLLVIIGMALFNR